MSFNYDLKGWVYGGVGHGLARRRVAQGRPDGVGWYGLSGVGSLRRTVLRFEFALQGVAAYDINRN